MRKNFSPQKSISSQANKTEFLPWFLRFKTTIIPVLFFLLLFSYLSLFMWLFSPDHNIQLFKSLKNFYLFPFEWNLCLFVFTVMHFVNYWQSKSVVSIRGKRVSGFQGRKFNCTQPSVLLFFFFPRAYYWLENDLSSWLLSLFMDMLTFGPL